MADKPLDDVCKGYRKALSKRRGWEELWSECLRYGQPARKAGQNSVNGINKRTASDLFDGTAADGVEQLAASLLAELTPPWSKWFAIVPGQDIDPIVANEIGHALQDTTRRIQSHFDRSNFSVEMHQCLLDVVTCGTATLLFEEAPPGSQSAFRFTAVPATEMLIDGNSNGLIENQFRQTNLSLEEIICRFPTAFNWSEITKNVADRSRHQVELVESVRNTSTGAYYTAYVTELPGISDRLILLSDGSFEVSPFITFRWMKGSGEIYGRSPVMSALPEIKTANKVVELILKNASIAVTGIWLAEDDGVLNPANIHLVPGSIIPKAAGSSGLTPLQSPGRLDVSQLVLGDLRARIRHTLLTDRLAPVSGNSMTATEVLERSAEASRLLGAIYGRLQTELLTPLVRRSIAILARRGEIAPIKLDGSLADIQYLSPLARTQSRNDMHNVVIWLETLAKLESAKSPIINKEATARWLAQNLGVPSELVASDQEILAVLDRIEIDP